MVIKMNDKLTERIILCAYKVHNTLGAGFLEKVYENALLIELKNHGLVAESQVPLKVFYDGVIVGDYFADIIVENEIVLELKAIENLHSIHEVQLVNYLNATDIEIGLLINFGSSVKIKRKFKTYNG
jgi:GxxExxY protein